MRQSMWFRNFHTYNRRFRRSQAHLEKPGPMVSNSSVASRYGGCISSSGSTWDGYPGGDPLHSEVVVVAESNVAISVGEGKEC